MIQLIFTIMMAIVVAIVVNEHATSDHHTPEVHSIENSAARVPSDLVARARHMQGVSRSDAQLLHTLDHMIRAARP
jgi:uncharacterized membrane protein YraQ (UPF0718 family)